MLRRVVQDYYAWRRNYFPEDGIVIDAHARRLDEEFHDAFEDRLQELLARLKADFPFQSPRYAGHMVAEQTLPSIAGYFAAMLYNPNNVSREAAPVTVWLELEACALINRMLGYGDDSCGPPDERGHRGESRGVVGSPYRRVSAKRGSRDAARPRPRRPAGSDGTTGETGGLCTGFHGCPGHRGCRTRDRGGVSMLRRVRRRTRPL